MKRHLFLLVILAALAVCLTGSFAEEPAAPDLFDLYEETGTGEKWISTAAPVMNGAVLAMTHGKIPDPSRLLVSDGRQKWRAATVLPASDGMVSLILFGREGMEDIPFFLLADNGEAISLPGSRVRSGDALGSRINRAVYSAAAIQWKGKECLLLALSDDTETGAVLRTEDGKLAGMIAAEYAEGDHRYIAISSGELLRCLLEALTSLNQTQAYTPPEGYTVLAEGNRVTFDWSRMALPEVPDGEALYLVVADSGSDYLTYYAVGTEKKITMYLTPGRTYLSGLTVSAETPNAVPAQSALTVLPEAPPLTENAFRSLACAMAEIPPEGLKEGEMPAPAEEVTEELLRSGRAGFYSLSVYEVTEKQEDLSLLITLTDPRGNNYRYLSGWTYDPVYMDRDEWYIPLADTGLLDMLNEAGYPAGTYKMEMFIDGKRADGFEFEIK